MGERGQASVEFLGAVPFVLLVVLVVWQVALAGHAVWMSSNAARAAARAEAVGLPGEDAARAILPDGLEHGLSVRRDSSGRVSVRLRMPLLLEAWPSPISIGADARLDGRS